jgi:crossover junction endodeoxyribonuclease RuvC
MDYVLGVDISMTATGVVVFDNKGWHDSAVICTKPRGSTFEKRLDRAQDAAGGIMDFAHRLLDMIIVEGYSYGSGARKRSSAENEKNVQGSVGQAHSSAEFGGLVRAELFMNYGPLPFVEVPPATLKKFVTGKGNAPKDLMRVEAYKRWGVEFKTNDEVDAYSLARMGACLLGWDKPATKAQREAVEKVAHAQELSNED